MSTMNISAPFNSNNENFTILYDTGSQNVTITLSDINFWYLHQVRLAISEGTQLGALFVMFLVTWVMTTAPKRRTPVFFLNMLALGIGIMRSLFYSVTLLTRFNEIYCWFTGDITYATPGDRSVTIVAVLFNYCLIIVVNIALVLNAHTVCRGTRKIYYWPIVTISSIFLFVLVAWRFAFLVLNIQGALGTSMWIYRHHWFQMVSVAFETGSIWWFCFIFCGKLISTQRERRKIGMKGWPATQVLTSMAGATMIIPSIFAVFQYTTTVDFPEAGTFVYTLVALLLPLSSLWAGKVMRDDAVAFTSNRLWGGFTDHSDTFVGSVSGKTWNSESTRDGNPRFEIRERKSSAVTTTNTTTVDSQHQSLHQRDSTDIDLERLGVRVDKSYTVRSGRDS